MKAFTALPKLESCSLLPMVIPPMAPAIASPIVRTIDTSIGHLLTDRRDATVRPLPRASKAEIKHHLFTFLVYGRGLFSHRHKHNPKKPKLKVKNACWTVGSYD